MSFGEAEASRAGRAGDRRAASTASGTSSSSEPLSSENTGARRRGGESLSSELKAMATAFLGRSGFFFATGRAKPAASSASLLRAVLRKGALSYTGDQGGSDVGSCCELLQGFRSGRQNLVASFAIDASQQLLEGRQIHCHCCYSLPLASQPGSQLAVTLPVPPGRPPPTPDEVGSP